MRKLVQENNITHGEETKKVMTSVYMSGEIPWILKLNYSEKYEEKGSQEHMILEVFLLWILVVNGSEKTTTRTG